MNPVENNAIAEIEAIKTIHETLEKLSDNGKERVIQYVISLFGIDANVSGTNESNQHHSTIPSNEENSVSKSFESFAELYDAASPKTQADQALAAAFWLQFHEQRDGFDSQSANAALKQLGHGIANITAALTTLKQQKPALVLQVKKSGSSRQARKVYKITAAGEKAILALINGKENKE